VKFVSTSLMILTLSRSSRCLYTSKYNKYTKKKIKKKTLHRRNYYYITKITFFSYLYYNIFLW